MAAASPNKSQTPLIPEKFLDAPSQRLYCLSIGLLIQAIKLLDVFRYYTNAEVTATTIYAKWMLADFAYCFILSRLRVPRLNYGRAVVLLQIMSLWFVDGLVFGGISLHLGITSAGDGSSPSEPFSLGGLLSFGLLSTSSDPTRNSHLLGQHTVRMSPISTARLNAEDHSFCLAGHSQSVLIPILLNNTNPSTLRYSITPLGYTEDGTNGEIEYFDLSAKDLKAIEQSRIEALQLTKSPIGKNGNEEFDEYDFDDDDTEESKTASTATSQSNLQKTQSLVHIKVSKPGTLRIERVADVSRVDARLGFPIERLIVPCPGVEFLPDSIGDSVKCAKQDLDLQLLISIQGVPPLSLRWFKAINGAHEHFLVEGIEGGHAEDSTAVVGAHVPQQLQVPLTITLDALGTHVYALEEVIDAVGNVVRVGLNGSSDNASKITRSLAVLRRPSVSFKNCGPGNPASLRIGSKSPLVISANQADLLDAPWEIIVKYQPPQDTDGKTKPWQKTLKTLGAEKELVLQAEAPGEYTIVDVKGKWCEGDVLAPESCRVIEQPLPSAEIEWKKIHECSGDTGVSASLVLHGAKPFNVKFTSQRDKEPPREMFKMFDSSRAEFTHQPERSGHYTYTFLEISDANYKKIPLKGPSIDQIVHPLAAASFVNGQTNVRTKQRISSCEGNIANVDVELRGTGPWNLEIQVVGPQGSEILTFSDITTAKKTLQIPVPKVVDRDGGSFEIDLLSVEDAYKCKRSVSVPGVSVDVRRIKPTVKFYGQADKRHATVLEKERAELPLRLTGDGPWRIKYRILEGDGKTQTATLRSPNDQLQVYDQGTYEILEINDSQCPGYVIADSSTFVVSWLQRPAARLSPKVVAKQSLNGSYTLPSICEGQDEHVDLDLTGRPPFQIVYNIARGESGSRSTILEQPTFNSIQPRTRFQLQTSSPGRMFYEVKQLGDAAYPITKEKNVVLPLSQRLLFEQEVLMRPFAHFKNRNRVSYCLNDLFVPRDQYSSDAAIVLEGTPPFTLDLSIRNLAASQIQTRTVELTEDVWKLDLPSYSFHSIGPHLITIESVTDASGCAPAALDPLSRSIWVDVAETAAILPFDRREDVCVGDVSQFQLEGIPPWTIGYRMDGKTVNQETKHSPFTVSHRLPGEFAITSIAHQQTMCRAAVTDLRLHVHELPSAQVGHGKRVFQDIHEGDQAEIVFTLIGEPPFTFTYQRSEASPKKGGRTGRVLETHTVSRVSSKEYSIFSALEGTWEVTSISDRYCRYPQAPDEQRH